MIPQKAFERWREVLRPEGRIIIYDGNYRRGQNSLKITAWKVLSQCLITVTERKIPRKAAHGEEGGRFYQIADGDVGTSGCGSGIASRGLVIKRSGLPMIDIETALPEWNFGNTGIRAKIQGNCLEIDVNDDK